MRYVEKVKKYFVKVRKRSAMKKYLEQYVVLSQFLITNGSGVDIQNIVKDLVYNEPDEVRHFVVNELSRNNVYGFTAMMYASIKEDAKFLDMVIRHNLGSVNAKDCHGYTALMYACRFNKSDSVVRVLLDNGADVNKKSKNKKTAFDFAKENGNDIIVSRIGRAVVNRSIRLTVEKDMVDETREVRFNLD